DFATVDRSVHQDAFGLAVLIFLLLMEGVHPFAAVSKGAGAPPTLAENIKAGRWPYLAKSKATPPPFALPFEALPTGLQTLFTQCFGEGQSMPTARPTAGEWQRALEDAESHLVKCSKNERHVFAVHLRNCPWCKRM